MPTTVFDETFNGSGKLISSTERIVPDPVTSDKERIVDLEARLTKAMDTLDAVGKATTFADAKTEIGSRIKPGDVKAGDAKGEPVNDDPAKEVTRA